ncbi:MAG: VCBS repeat-containing protein [Phycisphaeraceae bacterium]|nr:VCBS repeat-containing protein [Phycisphaerales bacterium]QOJ18113.1 MAG: VCBS repeat-containing protein [Phycisphaeraceae bacterium]
MDLDGDGYRDIISGSWPGEIYIFRGDAEGAFAKAEQLTDASGKKINVGSASVVWACDWDEDGDLDLLIGNIEGHVHLVPNEGTRTSYRFGEPAALSAGGKRVEVGHGDAGPTVADWDGDGKHDLIVGAGDGSITWYRNTGQKGAPSLEAGQALVPPVMTSGFTVSSDKPWGMRMKVNVADYNGDGLLDLIAGDFNSRPVDAKPETDEVRARREQAEKNYAEVMARYQSFIESLGDNPAAKLKEREQEYQVILSALRSAAEEMQKHQPQQYQTNGYVWVFLRGKSTP